MSFIVLSNHIKRKFIYIFLKTALFGSSELWVCQDRFKRSEAAYAADNICSNNSYGEIKYCSNYPYDAKKV